MLQFIIGPKGSGKTTYIHRLLGTFVKNEGLDAILIVPKQFTFESDGGILEMLGPKDGCKVDVLSFLRLADTLFKRYGGITKPILTEGADAVMMSLAIESISDRLKFFSRHRGSFAFVRKILDEIKLFKQNVITPEQLDLAAKMLPDGILREKMIETALIYSVYDSMLEQSFFDDTDILTAAYESLLKSDFFDGKIVAIDAFSRFSGQELKLIERMLVSAKDVYITACTDDIENTDNSSVFASVNRTVRQICAIAKKNSVGIRKVIKLTDSDGGFKTYAAPELSQLEKNLYKPIFSPFEGEASAVTLCCAENVRRECDFAAREIKMLMRTGQYRCRDIAVIYRSAQPYEREIRQSLKKYSVPIFEDKRQPIENEPLIIAVRAILKINASGFSTDNLMRYAKTGLVGVSRDEISEAENYALMWDLPSKGWLNEWRDNPDGFGSKMNEQREKQLKSINETRAKIVSPLVALCNKLKGADGRQSMKLLYEFLIENKIDENLKNYAIELEKENNIELALEQQQVWDILMQVLDKIAGVLGEKCVGAKRLAEIFDLVISTESLGKLPDGFDEVYISDSDRIQTRTFKVAFVLGANASVFPQTYSESGLFGEFEKEKIRTVLPELENTADRAAMYERFMAYNSLCCGRERLYVTYSLSGTGGEKLAESELVTMIKKILPNCCSINAYELPDESLIESEKSAFELMARQFKQNTPTANALKQYFYSKPEYQGKMKSLERAAKKEDFAFEDSTVAKEFFGKNLMLSASRLEDYERCPFLYFCKHELKAKPRKIARLDPAQSGTLVHFVLQKLLSKHKGKGFLLLSKSQLDDELYELLHFYIETYMGGSEDKSDRFNYLYQRTLKILRTIVERLFCEFEDSDFEPCDFELKIDRDANIKPFKVELDDGYVELRGIVDRVDKMDVGEKRYIRVVDYKTGAKAFSLSDVLGGLGMQMLLYLVSIWRGSENYYGSSVIPAGVLYFPARFDPYSVERGDSETERQGKKIDGGKMDGMILDDGEVIKGMDRALSCRFLPLGKNKKTGAVSGNFINLQQLGALAKRMDAIMAQMGNNLHRGLVPAKPVCGKGHGDTCDYCDYKSVCMKSEGTAYRYIEKLTHSDCLTILEEDEKNGEKLD